MIALVGATATGKTALGIALARRLGGEIISVDSRQVYRGMDIGTAKATPEQQAAAPHHGLDLVEPDERFSAGEFARRARCWIAQIQGRGRVPILVGGTGFFLRALTHPIFREPPIEADRRLRLEEWLDSQDERLLASWLATLDPESAATLQGAGGRQRVLRALSIAMLTGRTLPWWHRNSPPKAPPLRPLTFGLELSPDQLRRAIDGRGDRMIADGLGEEVRALVTAGYRKGDPGMNATGYAELLPWILGERTLADALGLVRRNTWAYARRQRTWFRHQLPPGSEILDATRPPEELATYVAGRWEEANT